jgi:glycosyltransferase involved in cell wall biosynthesis
METHDHRRLALLDARIGRRPSGIGAYTLNLGRALAPMAAGDVTPIVRRVHRRRFRSFGFEPWVFPRSDEDPALLPDAAVIHGTNFHAIPHPRAQRVATFHDLGYLRLPECHPPGMPERLDAIVRESVTRTAVFLCDSASARDDLVEAYGVDECRCRVVHLGVGPEYMAAGGARPRRLPRWLRVRSPYLLHVGAMIPRKDVRTLVEAFGIVRRTRADLSLVLVGSKTRRWASDWPRVKEWMDANPDDARQVRVLGYVPNRYLPDLYRNAAACVSATRWEGFGLTVLEGLAAGRPVVSSNVSSIPEVAGELVHYGQPQHPETYASAILAALDAGSDVARADLGRAHAATFSWERTAAATLEGYRLAAGDLALS